MKPNYVLDVELLHAVMLPWLSSNPENDLMVRPNQETVQLYLQVIEYGFECNLVPRMVRIENPRNGKSGVDAYHLILAIDNQGAYFDARDFNPFTFAQAHCEALGAPWNWGDPVDIAIGHRLVHNMIETARTIPNLGMARSIDEAFSIMQSEHMNDHTTQANGGRTGNGRL